jgi:hypothetical protein
VGSYLLGKAKLDLCVAAAFLPYTSVRDTLCGAFDPQLLALKTAITGAVPAYADPDNRIGELKARSDVTSYVFTSRFLPSIPVKGFCREKYTGTPPASCPNPWAAYQ